MKTPKINRKSFIGNCAKIAACATFAGSPFLSYGQEEPDSYKDYTVCIFKCPALPCKYDSECTGCNKENTRKMATCTTLQCVTKKELPSCAHCVDLKNCDKDLWVKYPKHREHALKKQTEWGLLN